MSLRNCLNRSPGPSSCSAPRGAYARRGDRSHPRVGVCEDDGLVAGAQVPPDGSCGAVPPCHDVVGRVRGLVEGVERNQKDALTKDAACHNEQPWLLVDDVHSCQIGSLRWLSMGLTCIALNLTRPAILGAVDKFAT